MLRRLMTLLGAIVAVCGIGAGAASAAGGPPLPTATNGHTVQVVATGLMTPTSFAFGFGQVFEGDGGNLPKAVGGVYVLSGGKGKLIPGSPAFVAGLAVHKGVLYVSGANLGAGGSIISKLWAWSDWNGTTFTTQKVLYTAPKGFPGFNGIAFGADGMLYVGVDVSLASKNDHGPATAPFQYDVLRFDVGAKHPAPQIFAKGMRQPWQLAFPAGSSSPYVTDFGQDKPASIQQKVPDFLLRLHKGDNYGFPTCNGTSAAACSGFTKPFQKFPPHTDIGGIGIIGSRIYMTEFGFNHKVNPKEIPQLVWMPIAGGKPKPLVTGFAAPLIGLGINGGWLYFGDLTGTVYRLQA